MPRRRRGAFLPVATFVGSAALVGLVAPQAHAAGPLEFDGSGALTVEYGEQWALTASAGEVEQRWGSWTSGASMPTAGVEHAPMSYYSFPNSTTVSVTVFPPYDVRPLAAGSYEVHASIASPNFNFQSDTTGRPAVLTIAPAALGTETRAVSDPSNPANTIITSRFTGRFVDEFVPTEYSTSPFTPAGIWTFAIKDDSDSTVQEWTAERSKTDNALAQSMYWTGAEPGEDYTVTVGFTPTGDSAGNFTASSSTYSFTASEDRRPTPVSSASDGPTTTLSDDPPFSVPAWWVLLIGVVLVALVVFIVVFAIRLGRHGASSSPRLRAVSDSEESSDVRP